MKLLKHIELNQETVKKIISLFPTKIYKTQSHLFYEGQVPISGYLIVDGTIQVTKKKKLKKMLHAGSLIGISELLASTPSKISAEVFPNTEVCFLDKTTLLELYKKADNELAKILKNIFEK